MLPFVRVWQRSYVHLTWKRGKGGHSGCMTQPLEAINTPIGTRTGDLLYSSLHTFPFHPKPSSVGIYTKQSSGWHPRTETPFIYQQISALHTLTRHRIDDYWNFNFGKFSPQTFSPCPLLVFQQRFSNSEVSVCQFWLGRQRSLVAHAVNYQGARPEPQGMGGGGWCGRWDTRLTSSDPLARATLHVVVHSHRKSVHVGLAVWHRRDKNYRKSNNHECPLIQDFVSID